jgi:PST family polysaccharide transporter
LFFIFLLVFVTRAEDLVWVPLLQGLSALVILVVSLYLIRFKFDVLFVWPSLTELKNTLYLGHYAFISQFAPNLYNNASVFLLGVFTSPAIVGYYTAATRLIDGFISIGSILTQTFLPYLSRFIQQHFAFQTLMWVVGGGLTFVILLSADWLVLWMFGETYLQISGYIQWLAVSVLFIFIVQAYGTNFLMLVGKEAVVRNIALYTSGFYFFVALALIPLWGIYGAIFTLVMARATMALLNLGYYLRYARGLREGGAVG